MELFNPRVFFINAGRKLREEVDRLALISTVEETTESWLCICVAECDFHLSSSAADGNLACGAHFCERHYSGPGSTLMALIVNSRYRCLLREVNWSFRCGAAVFSTHGLSFLSYAFENLDFAVFFLTVWIANGCLMLYLASLLTFGHNAFYGDLVYSLAM